MKDISVLDIPRFDVSEERRDDFVRALASQAKEQVVLTTLFWPPGHLEPRWFAWLAEVLKEAHRVFKGPVTLAELTSEMFDDIVATQPEAILNGTGELVDQVFKTWGKEIVPKGPLRRALDERGLPLIADKMLELRLVDDTHLVLRNGWHTDREIKFGSFGSVAGGDGFVRYLAARLARKLATRKPRLIAYWTDPIRHETFPNIMDQLGVQLARRDIFPSFLQLDGSAGEPTVPGRAAPHTEGVVLAADVVASTTQVQASYDVLRRADIFPEVIAPLIAFSFTPKMKFYGNVRLIAPAIVAARLWKSKDVCDQKDPPKEVHTEATVTLPKGDTDLRLMAKGPFWSMMLAGGKVGHSADGDTRHLHHTFVEPGTRPSHLDALLRGAFEHLRDAEFALVYSDNKLCEAIAGRLKAHCIKPFMTFKARKVHGAWRVGSLKSALESELRIVVLDDGATTGLSLLHLCDLVRQAGLAIEAIIIVEDKLDPPMRRVVHAMADSEVWGRRTNTLFLHQSPPAPPSFVEGVCSTCEELNLLGAVVADRGPRPAFAVAAATELRRNIVWDATEQGQRDGKLMTMGHGYDIAAQYNSLLAGHPQLLTSPAMMDVCIRDAIPQMRAEGLGQSLSYLDPPLRERALLWLKAQDIEEIDAIDLPSFDLDLGTPGLRLSLILQRLGTARRREEFTAALDDLLGLVAEHSHLGESRYRDILQQLLRGLVRSPSRATWIEASITKMELASASAMVALREDLVHLNRAVPSIIRSDVATWGFDSRAGHMFQARLANVDRLLRDHSFVLDLRRQPWALRRRNGADVELSSVDAICWALAIVNKRQFTGDLTAFLKRVRLQEPGGQAQNQIDSVRRRAAKVGVGVVAVDRERRDTPGRRMDHCLVRGADPGIVLWRDDGSLLWSTFTRTALKDA